MKKSLIALAVGSILSTHVHANTSIHTNQMGVQQYHANLSGMTITTTPFSQQMGTQTLTATQIAKRPTGNGDITELLKSNPNVQFDNLANTSLAAGELEPARVSFHGEKFYNNNFLIDGLSNNNNIDPATNNAIHKDNNPNGYQAHDLPAGGEQSLWINSRLLEHMEVFDSNVSAKYGDFTGGVVNAKIKNPKFDRTSGYVSYRTTSDALTTFHVDDREKEQFESALGLGYQPRFTKQFYSASINQPINDKFSILLAYDRRFSTIPYYQARLNAWRNQQRQSETFLLKGLYKANNGDTISTTAIYAPHSSLMYRKDIKEGGFENQGGGYRLNIDWRHLTNWGKVNNLIGYQYDENTITNETNQFYTWWHKNRNQTSNVIDWATGAGSTNQTALQGGYGKTSTNKATLTIKQDYDFDDVDWGRVNHNINIGWEYQREHTKYQRYADTALNTSRWDTKTVCGDAEGCIDGEQFINSRQLYPARSLSSKVNKYSLYAENTMTIGRVELTPAVRISHNDFMNNTNIAPHFSFTADVFDNEKTKVFGGWNRYYSNNIFTYALKNGISTRQAQTRRLNADGTLSDWTDGAFTEVSSSKYNHSVSGLDTPYSDEVNVGVTQQIANTAWTLKWVNRHSKKSFARSQTRNEAGERVLDNSGWSKADTITLAIKPTSTTKWSGLDLDWSVGASWSDNRHNTANTYDDDTDTDTEQVIFDNQLMHKADLPALNYNRPWKAFADINMTFPDVGFTWGHRISLTAPYTGYTTSNVECPDYSVSLCHDYAGKATLYEATKFGKHINYDWRMSYKKPFGKHQSLELTMDVNNVLNRKTATQANRSSVTYEQGRNIWLGATYHW